VGKTRIHDLAAEFGIESGQLIELLAGMGIHVRSHMSGLGPDQVALVRARWEREKRRKAGGDAKKKTTRRRARKKADEPAEEPKPERRRPVRRRRSAAEVAARAAVEDGTVIADADVAGSDEYLDVDVLVPLDEPMAPEETAADVSADELEVVEAEETLSEVGEEVEAAAEVEAEEPAETEEEVVAQAGAHAAKPAREPVIPRRVPRVPRPKAKPKPQPKRSRPAAAAAGPRPVASAAPGEATEDRRRDRKRRKRGKRSQVDREAVQANISRTLASIKGPGTKRSPRRRDDSTSARELEQMKRAEEQEREKTTIRVNEFITVSELATMLGVQPTQIVTFCFKELSMMVTVNQRLDFDQIDLIAGEFGFKAMREEEYVPTETLEPAEEDKEEDLVARSPVDAAHRCVSPQALR
jgi:translation initiation factor IF-2